MDLLAQMAMFVRVVDTGSLSAAARALRLSLPAVSRQLTALEGDLGTQLLMRSTRRIALTEAGRKWYEGSTRVLREVDETRAQVESPHTVYGRLVVSAGVTIGLTHVVPRLPSLAAAHPRLHVDVRLEDRLVDFIADGVDLAIRGGAPPPDSVGYVAQPLAQFPRRVFAAPSYLRKRRAPRTPAELAGHTCLLQYTIPRPVDKWRLQRGSEVAEVDVHGTISCNAPAALSQLAALGQGLALLPSWLAEDGGGRLKRVLPEWETPPVSVWAIYRAELRATRKVRAFIAALTDPPLGAGVPG